MASTCLDLLNAAREPRQVRYGVIGTPNSLRRFKEWASQVSNFINVPPPGRMSKPIEAHHVAFPGFNEAFFATWPTEPPRTITDIDEQQLLQSMRIANRHEAIKTAVDVFVDRLVADRKRTKTRRAFGTSSSRSLSMSLAGRSQPSLWRIGLVAR